METLFNVGGQRDEDGEKLQNTQEWWRGVFYYYLKTPHEWFCARDKNGLLLSFSHTTIIIELNERALSLFSSPCIYCIIFSRLSQSSSLCYLYIVYLHHGRLHVCLFYQSVGHFFFMCKKIFNSTRSERAVEDERKIYTCKNYVTDLRGRQTHTQN